MVTPTFVMKTFETIVGKREAELSLMTARLYSPEAAFNVGLIDRLVQNEKQLLDAAHQEMEMFLQIPSKARIMTKQLLRKQIISDFLATRDENTRLGVKQLNDPVTQNIMGKYLDSLGKK
jgi:3,2-trans-enoyl-CoA isomerase